MPQLSIRLLGGFLVQYGERKVDDFRSERERALLAYLALKPARPHSREELIGLLWPELPEASARNNLRVSLHRLRKALATAAGGPEPVLVERDTIRIHPAIDVWTDVAALEEHLRRADQLRHDEGLAGAQRLRHLTAAAGLYAGEFAAGFAGDHSAALAHWTSLTRERCHQLALQAYHDLAEALRQRGDLRQAQQYARRQLELEPWREEAHRQLMVILAQSGERGAALAQYERCRRILAEEFGVEPSAETVALHDHIRAGTLAVPARLGPGESQVATLVERPALPLNDNHNYTHEKTLFVGRASELTRLHRHLGLALAAQGQVALLAGEAGSGKTALAQTFARQAQGQWPELVVVAGLCNAITGLGDPYHPFRAMIAQLAGGIGHGSAQALGREQARRLWKLLPLAAQSLLEAGPDLWDTFVPLEPHLARARTHERAHEPWLRRLEALAEERPPPGAGVVGQQRLFEQYAEFLRLLARHAPLLLLLDDLQWADVGTISLLYHLSRHLDARRIMILGIFRPADLIAGRDGERHPLLPVISELRRRFGDVVLDLEAADGRQFVEAFLDTQPNRLTLAFREAFFQLTRGQPLFAVELWRDLQERGDVARNDAGEWAALPGWAWRRWPARVEAVIGERIRRLPPPAQDILRVASVEGESFTAEVVARVLGIDERTTFSHLRRDLEEAHSLVQVDSVGHSPTGRLSRYKFRHILIRNYLYDQLDEGEGEYLHEAVGRELEAIYGDATGDIAVDLAQHFRRAGVAGKAAAYLQLAGEQAFRRSANQEAATLYREALALLETLPDGPETIRRELTTQMSLGAALMAGAYEMAEVEQVYTRALALARLLEDAQAMNPTFVGLWLCYLLGGSITRAYDVAEEFLALAAEAGDDAISLGSHYAAGMSLFFLGDFGAAYAHLEAAIRLYDPTQHRHLTHYFSYDPGSMAYQYAALAYWTMGYAERASALSAEGLRLSRQHANPFNLANHLNHTALLYWHLGEHQKVLDTAEEALAIAAKNDFPQLYFMATYCRGWGLIRTGQVSNGLEVMRQGVTLWLASGVRLALAHDYHSLAEAYLIADDVQQAWEMLETSFATLETGPFWEAELHRLRGELLIRRGAAAVEIAASFQQAFDIAQRQGARMLVLRAVVSRCRWYAQTGRRAEALAQLETAYGALTEGFETNDLREARALLETLRQPS